MSGPLLALGLGNSLLWSFYLLLTRHVVSSAQLDAWAYTLVQLLTAGLVMLWLGRATVKVVDDELWVGDAHVPLRFVDEVEVIPAKAKRKALGPDLDPAAFVAHRGWVGPVLRVYLNDPADPTPYWLFSVRNADKLAAILHN